MTASGHTPAVALTLGEAPLSHVKPKKRDDEELNWASKVGLPEGRHTPRWLERPGVVGAEVNEVVEQRRRVLEVNGVVTADRLAAAELFRRGDLRLRWTKPVSLSKVDTMVAVTP